MFETKQDALAHALFLAIAAPDEDKMRAAIDIAESIANSGMTLQQVNAAKARAQSMAGAV